MDSAVKPSAMELYIKGTETSLKQVFSENQTYWIKVFRGHSPKEPPGYMVYRKSFHSDAPEELKHSSNILN
jgi:hypothetical protein